MRDIRFAVPPSTPTFGIFTCICICSCIYIYISFHFSIYTSTSKDKSTYRFGRIRYPPRHSVLLELLRLVYEIITFTAVEMGMHDQVVSCNPLVWIHSQPAMSERGIWHATQIERQRNETHPGNRRRKDCLRMTCNNYLCFTQWWWLSSRLSGG